MEGEGKIFIGNKIMISTLTDLIEGLECKPKLILQKIKEIDISHFNSKISILFF